MKLHFVCSGNVYRSRLAESYANYLIIKNHLQNIVVSSSGIIASLNENGPISWLTLEILEENRLESYASHHWIQTTAEIINSQDLIIFMLPMHLQYCQQHLGFNGTNYEVWDVSDMLITATKEEKIKDAHQTFGLIKSKVDQLLSSFAGPNTAPPVRRLGFVNFSGEFLRRF